MPPRPQRKIFVLLRCFVVFFSRSFLEWILPWDEANTSIHHHCWPLVIHQPRPLPCLIKHFLILYEHPIIILMGNKMTQLKEGMKRDKSEQHLSDAREGKSSEMRNKIPSPPNTANNSKPKQQQAGSNTNSVPPPPKVAPKEALQSNGNGSNASSKDDLTKLVDSDLNFSEYKLNSKLSIDDFELLKVLGKGSFGKVMLVRKKNEEGSPLYAMKTLRKAALIKRNQLAHTSTERFILQNILNPFLVHLVYAFQTPDKLYMVLDYMGGGELFFWLKKDRKFSEARCRLYAAEMTLALEALHSANIVYRDLKPENILLDIDGHLRFTDFGLAKAGVTGPGPEGGTKTFCGTPEYLAPEILENKGHGKAVDWWAMGTLLYEMLYGLPPFYDTNVQRMYSKILNDPLRFSKSDEKQISDQAKDFLKGLLKRPIAERFGSGPGGSEELKQHPFLSPFDFNRVMNKQYKPEFKPPSSGKDTDVRNFDSEFTKEKAADSLVVSHLTGTMQEQSKFGGFTYVGDNKL